MRKESTTFVGLLVGLVLFFAVNVLANATLRSWRVDMTEENLYTLTEGSKKIAREVGETVRLKLFVSREQIEAEPFLAGYARRVEELCEEYELVSGGKVELTVIDPEPYSEAESDAVEAGLAAVPLGGGLDKAYFGLVGTNAVGDEELIRFFDPSQERFLEYEISRLIYTLDNPERTVVGVLSSLPLAGGAPNPMMRQMPQRWPVLQYLESLFEVRMLQDGLATVPDDVDVLLIAHPKGFAADTRYAIDQFVLRGGKAVVCVDPWCDADTAEQDPSNPFGGMNADKTSSLDGLLAAWGVELVPSRIAADRENALDVQIRNGEQWPMVVWLGLGEDAFDQDDAVTSRLAQLNLATAGILRQTAGATTAFSPLIQTSEDSMDLDRSAVQFQPDPKPMLAGFVPRNERYTVAARVTGAAQTAFPDGAPDEEAADADDPTSTNGTDDAAGDHVAAGDVQLVVIADADFLDERFWLRETFFGIQKTADNGDLLVNAIENLGGGDDLIGIRGRAGFQRPFERVEEIRRDANERYLSKEKELQAKLRSAEESINELLQQGDPNSMILSPEVETELERVREEMAETNLQLRDVHYNLGKDIKRLGTTLKWINIGLLPALIALTAVFLGSASRRRRAAR
jgi:ABC-type uncharacterized transport system involved in gliding motility auxiliary subunit